MLLLTMAECGTSCVMTFLPAKPQAGETELVAAKLRCTTDSPINFRTSSMMMTGKANKSTRHHSVTESGTMLKTCREQLCVTVRLQT